MKRNNIKNSSIGSQAQTSFKRGSKVKQHEFFQFGVSKFRKSFQKYVEQEKLLQNNVKNKLKCQLLVVSYGIYQRFNWKFIFSEMIQTNIVKLFSDDNNNQNMIKEISQIRFTFLQHLHLLNNQIESIEALSFIKFQRLTFIYLYGNKITNIKSLAKCFHRGFIQKIALAMNPIISLNRSQQNRKIRYNYKNSTEIILELYSDSNVMNEDLCGYFFPFFSKNCNQVFIKSKFRIHQPKILKMIQRMSPKVQIFQYYDRH